MPLSSTAFEYIRDLVKTHSALMLEPGKEYLVESRLEPLARQEGFASLPQMVDSLRVGPARDLHRKVVEAMTTNETSFFRDIRVFRSFQTALLPELVARRTTARSLSIWCAASSFGQEPYSVAMSVLEHRPRLDGWNIEIIASDISRAMIERARSSRYSQAEVNRGLPATLLVKYFEQHGSHWLVKPVVREIVQLRELNLADHWPVLPRMDVIFLRNVLIYVDLDTKKRILAKAARLLNPDGYLVLGSAETTSNIDDSFESVSRDGATYFRLRRRIAEAVPSAS